jgi:hypothetical protein
MYSTHSLAGEGMGRSRFKRGDRHCGTLGIYAIFSFVSQPVPKYHRYNSTLQYVMGGGGDDRCASTVLYCTLHSAHPQKTAQEEILGFIGL